MYTKESLELINDRYCKIGHHYINSDDVYKANGLQALIERTRSTEIPKAGDILQYLDNFGEYFQNAHIDKSTLNVGGNICEHASVPFISKMEDGISCNTSGGSWHDVPLEKMKYVGKANKRFCFWGSCGACAHGAIEIVAEVSVWEYSETDQKTPGYTTREYDRFFVSDSGEDSKYTKETGYRFRVSQSGLPTRAFKDKAGYDAWLTTFKGKVFDRGPHSNAIVWTWKQSEKHVSPDEFDAIPEPIDTMLFNGAVRKCKRIYDEAKHTVTTCFVWYWPEEGDFYEVAAKQNKIREEKYTLHWSTPEFILAKGVTI